MASNEAISASKLNPLASETKRGVAHDDSQGVTGDDAPGQAKLNPIERPEAHKHPVPHVHDGGSAGADETLGSTKLPPVGGVQGEPAPKSALSDEVVDASRIAPMGAQRETEDYGLRV